MFCQPERNSEILRRALASEELNIVRKIKDIESLIGRVRESLGRQATEENRHLFEGRVPALTKLYECTHCPKKFDCGRKLGGHISRSHKGEARRKREDY